MTQRPDFDARRLHESRFRLFGGGPPARPAIVVGPAILVRTDDDRRPWTLSVATRGSLQPVAPRCPRRLSRTVSRLALHGVHCRLASAIAIPEDFAHRHVPTKGRPWGGGRFPERDDIFGRLREPPPRTIYGWSLAYRFPDSTGPALVDPHEDVHDLPAFYESPLELLDRAAHLEARGIETRPIAILVQGEDFVEDGRGGRVNRYFPAVSLRP